MDKYLKLGGRSYVTDYVSFSKKNTQTEVFKLYQKN